MAAVTNYYEIRWLKRADIYFLVVLEARRSKANCYQGWFILGALRESLFHASS